MTKPCNFPGRKQERRIRALERLQFVVDAMEHNNAIARKSHFILHDENKIISLHAVIDNTQRNIETGGFKLTKKRCPAGRKNRKSNK